MLCHTTNYLQPLSQPTIFALLCHPVNDFVNKWNNFARSQLTVLFSGGRQPQTQHQWLSTVRCI
jgi:hypothetical protein